MKDLTYIKVKEGKLWASDMVKPDNPGEFNYPGLGLLEEIAAYEKAMEAFNQSFREVGNPEIIQEHLRLHFDGEGLHEVSGLQFEVRYQVKEILQTDHQSKWIDTTEDVCENLRHDMSRKVAILSLKQEQPSEEKEEHFLKKHFLIGKQIRYHYVDWEVGSFTPWFTCNHSNLKNILNDNSIDLIEIKNPKD